MKIFDCITFFRENRVANMRFEILSNVVDKFIICESRYDHKGNKKDINFKLLNKKFSQKVIHLVKEDPFPLNTNGWQKQAIQREFIFHGIKDANPDDFIMFSDPDEIPNPKLLPNILLRKKYGIFLQKHYVYKINLSNPFEEPWEGTRICKKKDLISIDYLRQKVLSKNIKKFWKIDKERNIQLIYDGGWHFNNLFDAEEISIKLKTFAHHEFSLPKFTNIKSIQKKIDNKMDLFERGHVYKKVLLDSSFPEYLIKNQNKFKDFILT